MTTFPLKYTEIKIKVKLLGVKLHVMRSGASVRGDFSVRCHQMYFKSKASLFLCRLVAPFVFASSQLGLNLTAFKRREEEEEEEEEEDGEHFL